jgi:superfamily II DNA/RNA helicase
VRAPRSIALNAGSSALARKATALTTHDDISTTPRPDITGPDIPGPDETLDGPEPEDFEPLAGRAPVRPDSPLFADLGVTEPVVRALADVGITRTFAIQEMTLPIALAGSDLIGQARTGTGKTLGFGVPLLQRLAAGSAGGVEPRALVVVPTRELCIQVARDLLAAGRHLNARVTAIYGGRAYEPQISALRKGVDVIVGTPGRLLDLVNQRHLRLGAVSVLVLDEADEMLDLGFLPDIERILARLPGDRQTMLFSATMPGPIVALARRFMRQPVHVRAEGHEESRVVPETQQFVYRAHALDKAEMLARILQAADRGLTMIFCRTKRTAQKVADELVDRGFAAAAVHGDLGQGAREQALRAFRSGKVDVLVATDVAARGLDVEGVTHVVNYQCPEDEKVYLHRIGRTGRAGAKGVAVTYVDWDELARWKMICDALSLPFHHPPETYSTSEHLYVDLDIPAGATGTLPRSRRTRAGLDAEEIEDLGETGQGRGGRPGRGRPDRTRQRTGSDPDAPVASGPGESRPRRSRSRRRTRAGQPVDGAAEALAEAPAAAPAEAPAETEAEPVTTAELAGAVATVEAEEGARRRRRRRGGRGRGPGSGSGSGSGEGAPESGTDQPGDAPAAGTG